MRFLLSIGLALLIAFGTVVAPSARAVDEAGASVATRSRSEQFAALRALATHRGEIALIVRFGEFDTPLPVLPPQAQQARMEAIQATREMLLADLAGWGRLDNVKRFRFSPHVALTADAGVIGVLEFHPLVLEVVEDELRAPSLQETVPLVQANTNAWAGGWTGAGQTIAILDSGVDKTHPFLAGKVVSEACYSTINASYRSTSLCPGGQDSTAAGSGVNCSGISGCDRWLPRMWPAPGRSRSFRAGAAHVPGREPA
jgi:subtilisin family serine protease